MILWVDSAPKLALNTPNYLVYGIQCHYLLEVTQSYAFLLFYQVKLFRFYGTVSKQPIWPLLVKIGMFNMEP